MRGKRQQYKTPPVRSFRSERKGFTPQSPPDEVAHWVTPLSTCSQTARKMATWTKTDRQTDALKQERIAFFYTRQKATHKTKRQRQRRNNRQNPPKWKTGTGYGVEDRVDKLNMKAVFHFGCVFEMEG